MGEAAVSIDQVRESCKNSLWFLCTQMLGFQDWDTIHDEVENFLARPANKKLLLLPRGHLKTAIINKGFVIKSLLNNPNIRILIANQVWDKSREMLREIKGYLQDKTDLPKIFGNFVSSLWNEEKIEIAQRTKSLAAPTIGTTGVEAEMTSTHFDLIILDDLMGLQNYKTKDQRDKVRAFYRSMINLLEPSGTLIVLGTRWHLDDLYQTILDNERDYYDVMVRSVVEDGRIIFPKKFNLKFNGITKQWEQAKERTMDYINFLKKSTGQDFFSQYMNNPTDDENQLFKTSYFKHYSERPANLFVTMCVDPAISESQSADYTGIVVAGRAPDKKIYVLDTLRGKWGSPKDIVDQIFLMKDKWRPDVIAIEENGFQKALRYWAEDEMKRTGIFFNIETVKSPVKRDGLVKEYRIKGLEPYYRNGYMYHQSWMKDLEEELAQFPRAKHDDLSDALSWCLDFLIAPDAESPEKMTPGTWEYEAYSARKALNPYDFFNE
jgi:predicted phage terminase large subunit-like protein